MNTSRGPARGHPRAGAVAAVLAALGLLAAVTGATTHGGFTAGIGPSSSSSSSGTGLLGDTIGGATCLSSPDATGGITTNRTNCPTSPLSTRPGTATTVTLSSTGSLAPTVARLTTTNTCGVQQFVDTSSSSADAALAVGGVTYRQAGPTPFTDAPASAALDGTDGWLETLAGPPSAFYASPGPQTFSVVAWFRTTTSGSIIGFSDAQSNTGQGDWDRHLWVDPAGHVVFGVYPGTTFEVSSGATTPRNYADGAWHFAVATVAPASATRGTVLLSVDGTRVAGSIGNEPITASQPAQAYGGWWHLGWSNVVNGWPDPPTSAFWNGNLADLAVFPVALTAPQITALSGATTQTSFAGSVATDAPQSYWPLQDTGSSLYTGPIANLGSGTATYRDASGNPGTDTGTGQGTLTPDPAGPIGDSATAFDGTSGWIQTATGPPTAFYSSPGPQSFSVAAWFKTTSSGSIIGFSNAQGDSGQSAWDRQLWIDSAGHVVFGLYPNHFFEVSSAATTSRNFADGTWHLAVATVAPAAKQKGTVLLYVDGTLVAGTAGNETITRHQPAQVYGGWWHLGWSNAAGTWADGPTDPFWTGSLGQVAVVPTDLTAAQVASLSKAGSASSYASAVTGRVAAANAFWPLDDAPSSASTACSFLGVTVQAGSGAGATCLAPVSPTPCPGVSPSDRLSVNAAVPLTLPPLTFTTALTGAVPAAGIGLHVSVAWALTTSVGGFTAELDHADGYVLL